MERKLYRNLRNQWEKENGNPDAASINKDFSDSELDAIYKLQLNNILLFKFDIRYKDAKQFLLIIRISRLVYSTGFQATIMMIF